ncbi:MAG: hypothetical protein KKA64_00475 [Nanoarchaeota archaeon]|nr:hypothetical protein [Nanoarchaeota archaeon]
MIRDKRGLSTVVTTLIIILLTLVAIGIIWFVVRGIVESGAGGIDVATKCLNVDVKATAATCTASTHICNVTVSRGMDSETIDGVSLMITSATNSFKNDTSFKSITAGQTLTKTGIDYGTIGSPTKVKLAAYFNVEGVPQYCTANEFTPIVA